MNDYELFIGLFILPIAFLAFICTALVIVLVALLVKKRLFPLWLGWVLLIGCIGMPFVVTIPSPVWPWELARAGLLVLALARVFYETRDKSYD